jgi:hypothetical protein
MRNTDIIKEPEVNLGTHIKVCDHVMILLSDRPSIIIPPLPEGGGGYTVLPLSICPTVHLLLYPRSPKGEGGILFYLCPSVRPSIYYYTPAARRGRGAYCFTSVRLSVRPSIIIPPLPEGGGGYTVLPLSVRPSIIIPPLPEGGGGYTVLPLSDRPSIIIPPLPEGGGGYTVLPLSVCPSVQDIFRRIFLSSCWWQQSDIWSQGIKINKAGKQEVGIWWVQKRFPRYGVPIWSLWPNIRSLPSIVAEKNATKNVHICSMCIKTN